MPSITLYLRKAAGHFWPEASTQPGYSLIALGYDKHPYMEFNQSDFHDILYGKEITKITLQIKFKDTIELTDTSANYEDFSMIMATHIDPLIGEASAGSVSLKPDGIKKLENDNFTVQELLYATYISIWASSPKITYAAAYMGGPDSDYPPRAIVEYDVAKPKLTYLRPSENGYAPKHIDKEFTWGYFTYDRDVYGEVAQKSYVVEIINGESGIPITFSGNSPQKSVLVPAGTLTADTGKWRVTSTTVDGYQIPWSEWIPFYTVDKLPKVTPLEPADTYMEKEGDITFSWNYAIATGTSPTRADLQYSSDGLLWNDLAQVTGPSTTIEIDSALLPAGTLRWRVRGYNSDGVAGEWSEAAAFVLRGAPNPPIISEITNAPRPLIKWEVENQIAYQVQIEKELDTGEMAGTGKEYQVLKYMPKGNHVLRIRVKNESGQWSAWTTGTVSIAFISPPAPEAAVYAAEEYVRLTVSNKEQFAKIYLLRDGKPIGKFSDGAYVDYTSINANHYTIRGVDGSDRWADTQMDVISPGISGVLLTPVNDPENTMRLEMTFSAPRESAGTTANMGEYISLAGRRWPVWEYSGNSTAEFTVQAAEIGLELKNRLEEITAAGETLLYRSEAGDRAYCVVDSLEQNGTMAEGEILYSANMALSQVDYQEEIAYDPPESATRAATFRRAAAKVEILIGRKT